MSARLAHPVVAISLSTMLAIAMARGAESTTSQGTAGAPATGPVRVTAGAITVVCRLTLGGSFEAVSKAMAGDLTVADDGRLSGALHVPLDSLDTGIGLRNTHMRENYLETGRGADFARATLAQIALARPDIVATGGQSDFEATLTLHGQTRPVRGSARLTRAADRVTVEARFPVSLSAYAIPEPRYLGIGVRDDLDVRVDATFAFAGGAR